MHERQSEGFLIRAKVQSKMDVIRSATIIVAELFQMSGQIGVVQPGAFADLLVVDGAPSESLNLLQGQGKHLKVIMKQGNLYNNELN